MKDVVERATHSRSSQTIYQPLQNEFLIDAGIGYIPFPGNQEYPSVALLLGSRAGFSQWFKL